jgi:hypothetical protein
MSGFSPLSEPRKWQEPAGRGYNLVYHAEAVNHCPGCGRTHWIIGRMSAECAFCATALPLAEASFRSVCESPATVHRRKPQLDAHPAWAA